MMRDKPDAAGLLEIAEKVLRETVIPAVDRSAAYEARMIANAIAISRRQILAGDLDDAVTDTLHMLLEDPGEGDDLNRRLAALIRTGEAPRGTLEALKDIAAAKLAESNPRYLAKVLS